MFLYSVKKGDVENSPKLLILFEPLGSYQWLPIGIQKNLPDGKVPETY
jgi:hypothetical protein